MLSNSLINQIFSVASVINDEWKLSDTSERDSKNPLWKVGGHTEILINRGLFSDFRNIDRILHKMQYQYGIIGIIADPTDNEDEEYGDNYAFIITPEFDEFYDNLHHAANSDETIDDKDLTPQKASLSAELVFISIGRPAVRINGKSYEYSTMQTGGLPFNIVEHCLTNHPNQIINNRELAKELQERGLPHMGITNITEIMRKSPLFGEHGILSFFIETTPDSIRVRDKLIFPSLASLNMLTLPSAKDENIQRLLKVTIDKEFRNYIRSKSPDFSE